MSNLRSLAGPMAIVAIAVVAWSCETHRTVLAPTIGGPLFQFNQIQCRPLKMTGGGRIDYPPGTAEKNPPASHLYETFGAHVIGSSQEFVGNTCPADKGSLEWVDHRPEMRLNGSPLNLHATSVTFAELVVDAPHCTDGAVHWGGTLRVQNTGQENLDFEVFDCDAGEPGVGQDGFAIRVIEPIDGIGHYEVTCDPSPAGPTCTLTGGNRQFHPTH
jgi:hypothetical protein